MRPSDRRPAGGRDVPAPAGPSNTASKLDPMPKLPRSTAKSGNTTAAKAPAKPAKPASDGKTSAAASAPHRGQAEGAPRRRRPGRRDFERHPVDEHTGHAPRRARRRSSPRTSASCSATCSPSSRSTPTRPPSEVDRDLVERAFVFACERHADQRRASGEDFIVHPVGVAKICAGMRLDTATLCAALLHDTVEDTSASLDEVEAEFGDEIGALVDGVTKLSGVTFQSRDDRQAENYRKMMVAMAQDIRVILIKLADRLHNMRTIGSMPKQKQQEKAKETLEIFAPLAHRLGIHAIKWELEDLAFATLHPRKYNEIKQLVSQQRDEREALRRARRRVPGEGARGGRHRGRDLRPRQALLLDLLEDDEEGPRVQRDLRPHRDARDRRLGQGLLRRHRRHPLALEAAARALQGLGRDAQVQHVPGAPHHGDRARGPAARDPDPHARDAPHRRVRRRRALDLQGGRRQAGRGEGRVAAAPARLAAGDDGPAGVRRDAEGRPVRGRGVRLHARRARSSRWPRAPRRSTSPTRSTPTSATAASARRSTARSCRCTTSSSRATSARC